MEYIEKFNTPNGEVYYVAIDGGRFEANKTELKSLIEKMAELPELAQIMKRAVK